MFSAIYSVDLFLRDFNQYEDKIHLLLGSYCTNSYCVYSPRSHRRHNILAKTYIMNKNNRDIQSEIR